MITETEREEKLKKLCDKEFLEKLTEVARLSGWSNDYVEIQAFVEECHDNGGVPRPPDLTPYDINYETEE